MCVVTVSQFNSEVFMKQFVTYNVTTLTSGEAK
jgi:hypothetical protein